jgi:competence ComEA-like helix-hairpin-helix protein
MIKNIGKASKAFVGCLFLFVFFSPHHAHPQGWSDSKIRSLSDSCFALIEVDKDGKKVRHLPYRDRNGNIDIDQLIYCLGTFGDEAWLDSEKKEIARRNLEEHYYRLRLNQTKEGMKVPININKAPLKDLVRLPNIGPVTAVKIYKFRQIHGPFQRVEDIKKVEGIGPATFAGIRYYIKVR